VNRNTSCYILAGPRAAALLPCAGNARENITLAQRRQAMSHNKDKDTKKMVRRP
jgi:hypothetical protein